jgi:hypothetical protein
MFEALRSLARKYPVAVSRQLQAGYAAAWQSLVETHQEQAVAFVQSMAGLMSAEEALDRYFFEVPVARAMQDAVRAGAVVRLMADGLPAEQEAREAANMWRLIESARQLARQRDQTRERATLAAARAAEALAATHLRNALTIEEVTGHIDGPEEVVLQYIRTLDLPSVTAQLVYQQALARLAERELAAERVHTIAAEPVGQVPAKRPLMLVKFLGAGA